MTLAFHLHATRLALHLKTVSSYRATLRANVRALWTGTWDEFEFVAAMTSSILSGLTQAHNEGLASVGATSVDVSPEERRQLREVIANETGQVDSLTDFILKNSKANGGQLQTCFDRLALWLNRYPQVFEMGVLAGSRAEDNLIWRVGPTEHCGTCATLNGIVASKAAWLASGLRPRTPPNPRLICGGWNCQCTLSKTELPATAGGIPRV